MKRLGIDVDGVIADFVRAFYQVGNSMFGTSYTGPQQTWDFVGEYTPEQQKLMWAQIRRTKDFWQTLDVLDGTNQLKMLPKGVEPVFITSRVPTTGHSVREQTCQWLRQNFHITHPFVIVADRPEDKIPIVKALGIDNFIDDKRSTIEDMQKAGLRSYAKLAPYNCGQPFPEGVIPVETLNEFLELEAKIV